MMHFPLSRVLLFESRMVCDHHPALRVTLPIEEGTSKWQPQGKFEHLCTIFVNFDVNLANFAIIQRLKINQLAWAGTAGVAGTETAGTAGPMSQSWKVTNVSRFGPMGPMRPILCDKIV